MEPCAPIEQCIVVDDDPVIRAILRSTLAGIGLGVHLASRGDEAIAIANRVTAGLFMLDLQMPGINGLETCRRLRAMDRYADTPIVVLTGHTTTRTKEAALAAGATMFLVKPFKPSGLLQALTPLLGGHPSNDEPHPGEPIATRADLWGIVDPEYRNQLWGRLDAERAAARQDSDLGVD